MGNPGDLGKAYREECLPQPSSVRLSYCVLGYNRVALVKVLAPLKPEVLYARVGQLRSHSLCLILRSNS